MNIHNVAYELKQHKYETEENITEKGIKYIFVSKGKKSQIKAIHYSLMEELGGKKIFNLGFGDYNLTNDTIADDVNSNNGDMYTVFNTVLSTVPRFFEIHHNAITLVKGSDSSIEFIGKCRTSCKKKCTNICRNADRRINIYRGYVDKNFDILKKDYTFYRGIYKSEDQPIMINYEPGRKCESVLFSKKQT